MRFRGFLTDAGNSYLPDPIDFVKTKDIGYFLNLFLTTMTHMANANKITTMMLYLLKMADILVSKISQFLPSK